MRQLAVRERERERVSECARCGLLCLLKKLCYQYVLLLLLVAVSASAAPPPNVEIAPLLPSLSFLFFFNFSFFFYNLVNFTQRCVVLLYISPTSFSVT